MVNTGKPSTGCGRCRARRIKCDEGRPSCSRCLKYKKPCPGYRDWTEEKLRYKPRAPRKQLNEDAIQGPLAPRIRSSSESSVQDQPHPAAANPSGSAALLRRFSAPEPTIYQTSMSQIDMQAECFFVANFVKVPEAGPNKGYLDFVVPLLNAPGASRCLPLAFSAVTLAAFGTHQHSPVFISKTRMLYLQALGEVNVALRDPTQALDDSVVASVLLLAKFEQISPSAMVLRGWKSHIDGAMTLLKARTAEQKKSRYGSDLIIAVREQIIPLSIAAGLPLDPDFDWLGVGTDDLDESFSKLNIQMSHLQANNKITTKLAERSHENIERIINLLRRAQNLEQQYTDWMASLPPSWITETTNWSGLEPSNLASALVYPGKVYSFGDLWMANKFSVVRSCRILLWSTILRCVAWLNGPLEYMVTPEYAEASRTCRVLIQDITSSVPYYFGWTPRTSPAIANIFEHDAEIQASMKGRGSIFLLWPLYVAALCDFASPSERTYLRGKLKYIAENLGVNQAVIALKDGMMHPSRFIEREGETFGQLQPAPRTLQENAACRNHFRPNKSEWIGHSLKQISPA